MKIIAILAVRNECQYIENALTHLVENGIRFAIIDNESTDGTAEIIQSESFRDNLVHFETLVFRGYFDLEAQLHAKQRIIQKTQADWYIHLDADEIMHSYVPGESLHDGIVRLNDAGAEVVNFDEFVFLPVEQDYLPNTPGPQPMQHYYFFEPTKMRLMRAWKATSDAKLVKGAGHQLEGDLRIAEESMALRHYIFRDADHARSKYVKRKFSEADIERGWHNNRIGFHFNDFSFPDPYSLHLLSNPADRKLDKSNAWIKHYWDQSVPRTSLRKKLKKLLWS